MTSTATLLDVPRPATGSIETHTWKDGRTVSYRLRVRANGERHRVALGTNHEGWSEDRARVELDRVMGQVERGTWQPPAPDPAASARDDETVRVTASRWWQRKQGEKLAAKTQEAYRWALDYVLADLAGEETSGLTVQRIDEFRDRLATTGKLSAKSINNILSVLGDVLEDAVEYEVLAANPARGRRRRMKVRRPPRNVLDPDMVVDLLDEAGRWEAELQPHHRYGRRALLATLCLGGLRIGELTSARRSRLDLHGGRLGVGDAKTEAGVRHVEFSEFLLGEHRAHLAALPDHLRRPSVPVFPTRSGRPHSVRNIQGRLLQGSSAPTSGRKRTRGVVERVNERRGEEGRVLLPERVTPHTLRRTFASLAFFAGRDPRWVMGQIGHKSASFTLSVYAQAMQRKRVDYEVAWRLMRFPDEQEASDARSRAPTT